MQLFDPQSANAKVIVLFTDGKTTAGSPPAPVAAAARAEGIILYCIGLIGSDGIDVSVLNDWATDPDASHVAVTPDAADLEDLFRDLAANISKTGATDIVIDEVVNDDFQIASMSPPTKGTAEMQSSTALQWKIPELGVTANEGASLQFAIRHTAGNGVDGLHMAQVGRNHRNMPYSADRSVLGGSKNAVGQHINMEIHNAEAAGHDLHGVLRAEHLAAIGQHSLAAVHDQIERQVSHECSPAQRQTPGNGHTGAGQWLPSTGSRAPSRYQ